MPLKAESSPITTRPPLSGIKSEHIQPPTRVYITVSDRLYIRSRNSLSGVTLRIAGRLLTSGGEVVPLNYIHTPGTDRSVGFEDFQAAEGYLLALVCFPASGAPLRGQTFVELGILRGRGVAGDVVDVLARDYVAEAEPVAFPGSGVRSSLDGAGALRVITGTNPAAGSEVTETVPTDAHWHLRSLLLSLTADATVAFRNVVLALDNGSTEIALIPAAATQTASTTHNLTFAPALGFDANLGTTKSQPLPFNNRLGAGYRIRTETENLQAGDDWAAPLMQVEEWIED